MGARDLDFDHSRGDDTAYLKITADAILPPEDQSYVLYIPDDSSTSIDTQNPMENACLLRPLPEFDAYPCIERADEPLGDHCYTHDSILYTQYSTDPATNVEIELKVKGHNEWHVFEWGSTE